MKVPQFHVVPIKTNASIMLWENRYEEKAPRISTRSVSRTVRDLRGHRDDQTVIHVGLSRRLKFNSTQEYDGQGTYLLSTVVCGDSTIHCVAI